MIKYTIATGEYEFPYEIECPKELTMGRMIELVVDDSHFPIDWDDDKRAKILEGYEKEFKETGQIELNYDYFIKEIRFNSNE